MARTKILSSVVVGEWGIAVLLAANLLWTSVNLGGYRAETMVISIGLTGAALALHFGYAAWNGQRPHPAGLWLLGFLVYALFNVLVVSPVRWLGWFDWLGWAQMVAVFWLVLNGLTRRGPRALVLGTIVGLGVVAVVLASYQRFVFQEWLPMGRSQAPQFYGRASGFFGIPNSLAAFMLLLIPPMLALCWQRGASAVQRVGCGYLAALFLFGLGLTISRGPWLSLVLALVAWPLCVPRFAWATRITLSAGAFGAALMTGMILYSSVPMVKQRLDSFAADSGERSRPILWQASIGLFETAPLLGTGAGSYNVLFERERTEGFRDEPEWAHNEYLNTLSDYGLVGFVLFFGAAALIGVRAVATPTTLPGGRQLAAEAVVGWTAAGVTAAMGVGLAAFAMSLFVDFHFKIPALAMVSATAAGEWVRRSWIRREPAPAGRPVQVVLLSTCLVVALFTLGVAIPAYRAEALRAAGREHIDRIAVHRNPSSTEYRQALTEAAVAISQARLLDPDNAQAWADSAYVTELWSHFAPTRMNALGREAEAQAAEALDRSSVVPEFWIRRGVALDMQGRWAEAGGLFVKALELAPLNATAWYYHAYHLSLNEIAQPLALAAIENSLRLDPTSRFALALRQRITSTR